jgi:hypothetical protein
VGRAVPFTGNEKESLHISLDRHRDAVLWKPDRIDDEDLRRPLVPSGTSLLGLVKHLASVEYGWFCATFGRESEAIPFHDDDHRPARGTYGHPAGTHRRGDRRSPSGLTAARAGPFG